MSIPLYWMQGANFGDALSPWLVERITGTTVQYVEPNGPVVPYFVTGSIFGSSVHKGIVWGAGCAYETDLDDLDGPSDHLKVLATRGVLTRAKAEARGHVPVAVGDPAMLLPRFYDPKPRPRARFGIICSWVDRNDVRERLPGVPLLDCMGGIEETIDELCSWDVVIASSLHGLIAAIAYGKRVVWARFSDRQPGTGTFKWDDFLTSLGTVVEPVCSFDLEQLLEAPRVYPVPDLGPFWDACPLKRLR